MLAQADMERSRVPSVRREGDKCPNAVVWAPSGAVSPGGNDGVHPIFQNRLRGLRVQRDSKLHGRAMGQGAGASVTPHSLVRLPDGLPAVVVGLCYIHALASARRRALCALIIVRTRGVRVLSLGGARRTARARDEPLTEAFKRSY